MNDHLVNLNDGALVNPKGVLLGAWRGFMLHQIPVGESDALDADGVEHFVYVVSGSGTATTGGGAVSFGAGSAFTIVRGDGVRFEAAEPLELFVATLQA